MHVVIILASGSLIKIYYLFIIHKYFWKFPLMVRNNFATGSFAEIKNLLEFLYRDKHKNIVFYLH